VSDACPRQHVREIRRRERLRAPPCFDCKAGGGAVRGEYQKQNIVSASIPLTATCNDMASASIVAPPPLFELYCTLIGPFPKRLATTARFSINC
jgi:hypothetical protein